LYDAAFNVFGTPRDPTQKTSIAYIVLSMQGWSWIVVDILNNDCPSPPSNVTISQALGTRNNPIISQYASLPITTALYNPIGRLEFCVTGILVVVSGYLVDPDIYSYDPLVLRNVDTEVEVRGYNFGRRTWFCLWTIAGNETQAQASLSLWDPRILHCPFPTEGWRSNIYTASLILNPSYRIANEEPYGPFKFTIYDKPTISFLKPGNGTIEGGTNVTITGKGFLNVSTVTALFGLSRAANVTVLDGETISCVTPAWIPDPNKVPLMNDSYLSVPFALSLDGRNFFKTSIEYQYYLPISPLPTPSPTPPTPSVWDWIKAHPWAPIIGAFGLLLLLVGGCWLAISIRRDDGYVELSQVATNQDLGSNVVIKASDIIMKKRIGRGQFSDVYHAIYRFTEVAVKRLRHVDDVGVVEELIKEARVMLQLRHPNVVAFMGITAMEGTDLCLVTEYLPRGSLYDVLVSPNIDIEAEHRRRFSLDCCCGMDYLHSKNLIHRDLKSKNLLVSKNWEVKVGDFGLSKFLEERQTNHTLTACGTPVFAAPEVLLQEKYSFKADVYSFGIVLYEIWVSTTPFKNMSPYRLVIEVSKKGRRPIIPENKVTNEIAALMRQCWHESPELRPSFSELVTALRGMIFDVPVAEVPVVRKVGPAPVPSLLRLSQKETLSTSPGWLSNISNSVAADEDSKFLYQPAPDARRTGTLSSTSTGSTLTIN